MYVCANERMYVRMYADISCIHACSSIHDLRGCVMIVCVCVRMGVHGCVCVCLCWYFDMFTGMICFVTTLCLMHSLCERVYVDLSVL